MVGHERVGDVEVPEDLAKALRHAPAAAAQWEKLSYTHRRAHVTGIQRAKDPKTRARRIEEAIKHLLEE